MGVVLRRSGERAGREQRRCVRLSCLLHFEGVAGCSVCATVCLQSHMTSWICADSSKLIFVFPFMPFHGLGACCYVRGVFGGLNC